MHVEQKLLLNNQWEFIGNPKSSDNNKSNLVLVFGSYDKIIGDDLYSFLSNDYPFADIIFCSTAGEIAGSRSLENSVSVTAVQFEKTPIKCIATNISEHDNSFDTGRFLRNSLNNQDLKCVFIISDGTLINGSELVAGLNNANTSGVLITGGLPGDGDQFETTVTSL